MLRGFEFIIFAILLFWFLRRKEILADWSHLHPGVRLGLGLFFTLLVLAQALGVDRNFHAQGGAAYPFIRTSMFSTPPSSLGRQKSFALEITDRDGNTSLFEPAALAWSLASNWRYATNYHVGRLDGNPEQVRAATAALQGMLEGWARVYYLQKGIEPVSTRLLYRDVRYREDLAPETSEWRVFP